ncbi:alpha/beta hydrolase [Bacillus sp. 31A1R]|uniref:Alpha/beta hydrolase n=1 Tax=Robertmurraya mangrovi TaxID=3098077 RepID=A0ABU5J0Q4_9BACI|nr:alpha/beta hydrolase [Bacillus sp. 31A1R]MDZ5473000.1 alpha/beta hydrolase [Bacillus sp. 31A1R]
MEKVDVYYQSRDGVNIHSQLWKSEAKPRAIVQIAHGMAEHIERYDHFARFLVENDCFVYGNDHRGHGKTAAAKEQLGYFSDERGFDIVVEDMLQLTNMIEKKHPQTPIILFGHSMGSFLARRLIQMEGTKYSGVILSGTGGDPGWLGKVGIWLAAREVKKKGKKAESPLLEKAIFGSHNKSFKPNRTEFDWLSRDESEVDKYIEDPLCGNKSKAGFFLDLLTGISAINKMEWINQIPKDLPIYLFSGDQDPVGNFSKGVLQVFKSYVDAGIKDVTYKLYPNGRHEMLNELNKEEVYKDILNWMNEKLSQH